SRSLRYLRSWLERGREGRPCNRNPPQRTVEGPPCPGARLNTRDQPDDESDEEVSAMRGFDSALVAVRVDWSAESPMRRRPTLRHNSQQFTAARARVPATESSVCTGLHFTVP
ncbi:hypothetical protein ALC62_04855, partial [Cyphomyrmex costatus]